MWELHTLGGGGGMYFCVHAYHTTDAARVYVHCVHCENCVCVCMLRLISEHTIEENILKKANQKRLLGDVAIEDGGFTPSFFKQVGAIVEVVSECVCLSSIHPLKLESVSSCC